MSLPVPFRPSAARGTADGGRAGVLAALAAAVAVLAACTGGGDAGGPSAGGGDVSRYETRGVVVRVPDPADPLADLVIRHEAIDDFRGINGEVVGMDSMSMPFPVANGVDLAGVVPGAKVAFTLEVEWEGEPPYRVTRIAALPADTELDFRQASPPGE